MPASISKHLFLIYENASPGVGKSYGAWQNYNICRWYKGKSKHKRPAGLIPQNIVNYITGLPVDNGDWAFGWNCAEVDCIIQADAQ